MSIKVDFANSGVLDAEDRSYSKESRVLTLAANCPNGPGIGVSIISVTAFSAMRCRSEKLGE